MKLTELWDKVSDTTTEVKAQRDCKGMDDICTQQEDHNSSEHRDMHLLKAPDWKEASPLLQALASQAGISFGSCSCGN